MVKKEDNLHKRLFVAIDIPEHIKKYLYETTDNLFSKDKDIRKILCPNIHVTLKFLGNVNLNKIENNHSINFSKVSHLKTNILFAKICLVIKTFL